MLERLCKINKYEKILNKGYSHVYPLPEAI